MPDWNLEIWHNDNLSEYLTEIIDLFTWDVIEHKYFTYISDVLRLMILRDHGGVYLDHDMIVVKDFTDLVCDLDFFTTYQFSSADPDTILPWQNSDPSAVKNTQHEIVQSQLVNPCIIGSRPDHDVLTLSLEKILYQETLCESDRYPLTV
jgi:mannosyltransferase OCH1-like enzyme